MNNKTNETEIQLKFNKEFHNQIKEGKKTATTRLKKIGNVGDRFTLNNEKYILTWVRHTSLFTALELYKIEGFNTSDDMYNKIREIYPNITYFDSVYVHKFAKAN